MVGRLAPAAAVHVLVHDGGVAGNIFLQKRQHRADAIISRSAGGSAVNDSYGLALIEWDLSGP